MRLSAHQRRAVTDDEEQASWDYTEEQRLVRNPGSYLLTGTELVVNAAIARNPMSVIERDSANQKCSQEQKLKKTLARETSRPRYGANPMDRTEAGVRLAGPASST